MVPEGITETRESCDETSDAPQSVEDVLWELLGSIRPEMEDEEAVPIVREFAGRLMMREDWRVMDGKFVRARRVVDGRLPYDVDNTKAMYVNVDEVAYLAEEDDGRFRLGTKGGSAAFLITRDSALSILGPYA